jgi:hypothetical protein
MSGFSRLWPCPVARSALRNFSAASIGRLRNSRSPCRS